MRRRHLITFGSAAMAAHALPAFGAAGWRTLFNGHGLDAWDPVGDANWAVKDGAVQADNGKTGFLVSKETFGDVAIRAEFWVSHDANSGIFVRATNPFVIGTATGYEMNIYDERPDPTYGTGAIVGVAKVNPMPKAGGRWNVMEIWAKGDRFTIVLNGAKTVDNVQDGKFSHGRIALQYGLGLVKFRKVQVRSL
ncbi:MAG TPA: DUF1080 domain-containing protein [Phenylobacterium sp.]